VCQVATVVMEATQLVLSQINYFFIVVNRELIRSFCAKSY